MGIIELFLIAVGLSMDAFAVSVCKGLSAGKVRLRHALIAGLWFGGFQALMPFLGWLLGVRFQSLITNVDHWIAFVLLAVIGINMIRESRKDDEECVEADFSCKSMFPLAIATSIDALTVGITFAFLQVDIVPAVTFIGVTTFVLSAIGVRALDASVPLIWISDDEDFGMQSYRLRARMFPWTKRRTIRARRFGF